MIEAKKLIAAFYIISGMTSYVMFEHFQKAQMGLAVFWMFVSLVFFCLAEWRIEKL